jgi:hypothetical protein
MACTYEKMADEFYLALKGMVSSAYCRNRQNRVIYSNCWLSTFIYLDLGSKSDSLLMLQWVMIDGVIFLATA